MTDFTHLDSKGKPAMVDVAAKQSSRRIATARSIVVLPDELSERFGNGGEQDDILTKKGAVFQTAIIAGIMAAKKTGELIPLCHPLGLDSCDIRIEWKGENEVHIECTASVEAKTGVEMEALVGASVAALTIYDMCKAFSHDIIIRETKLMMKRGGKNDFERK
jgi:cyclic pyranopterin monophosphate synthase